MGRRTNKRNIESWVDNNQVYIDYYEYLKSIALNLYNWKNLPDGTNERFLEKTLFYRTKILFFKDEVTAKYYHLPFTGSAPFDLYGETTKRIAKAENINYVVTKTDKDSVIIYNSYSNYNTDVICRIYAKRLYELQRTIDVNIKAIKTPVVLKCSEQQRLSFEQFRMKTEGNEAYIFADDSFNVNGIQAVDLKATYYGDKLEIQKHMILNEFLTRLGIENANNDKKERLVSDEVSANSGNVEIGRSSGLKPRREACALINEMFDLEIDVVFNSDLISQLNRFNAYKKEPDNFDIIRRWGAN